MKKKPSKIMQDQEEKQFEAELFQAILLKHWLIPQTDAEVASAEREMEREGAVFSSKLVHLRELFSGTLRHEPTPESHPSQNEEIEQNLAWAARNGQKISPGVWKRMQEDRASAEAKRNHER